MTNCGDKTLVIEKGKAFAQGIFVEYGITFDDDCTSLRTGGIGSTDKK
jgi:dUTP pyrophosphatase